MARKHKNNYFELTKEMIGLAYSAAIALDKYLNNFNILTIDEFRREMHDIEHTADIKKHEMLKKLAKEFITPIEREDIMLLAQEIDNVTDSIEDVLVKIDIYNIKQIRPEAQEMTAIIIKCCDKLQQLASEFVNFKKSTVIHEDIVIINRLEEDGDRLYNASVSRLFRECSDPIEIFAWKDIFDCLETCCDACEHVCDVIESVIMKNT